MMLPRTRIRWFNVVEWYL